MNKNNETYSTDTVTFQSLLRPALTPVLRNRDYDRLVADLRQLDDNLTQSGLETWSSPDFTDTNSLAYFYCSAWLDAFCVLSAFRLHGLRHDKL